MGREDRQAVYMNDTPTFRPSDDQKQYRAANELLFRKVFTGEQVRDLEGLDPHMNHIDLHPPLTKPTPDGLTPNPYPMDRAEPAPITLNGKIPLDAAAETTLRLAQTVRECAERLRHWEAAQLAASKESTAATQEYFKAVEALEIANKALTDSLK
jgi:hypothetical protein